jgi:BASS family bile acid:Na+ symporter
MLEMIAGYAVPAGLLALMLIAGTELVAADFARVAKHPKAVLLGAIGQLIVLPPLGLLIAVIAVPAPPIATALLVISLCPGGAISNYYCYLARCSVLLSATITAMGTVCSLLSMPLWLWALSGMAALNHELPQVPAWRILSQLAAFMVLPMALGMLLCLAFPKWIEAHNALLRGASFAIVLAILVATTWVVRADIAALAEDIVLAALVFIAGAMILGHLLAYGMKHDEGPVLVIESAVRNVGIALIIGRSLLGEQSFGVFVSFLTGYFIIEMIIMLAYAQFVRAKLSRAGPALRIPAE